jgi:hypothetical protein
VAGGQGEAERDPAAEAGRLTGQAVNAIGLRLLRLRTVRRTIRRAAEEARSTEPGTPARSEEESASS